MEPAEHLARLRADGAAVVSAATADPSAPVPGCPDWDVTALVAHLAGVHRWAAGIVRSRATEAPATRASPPDPTDSAGVLTWYAEGLASLIDVLEHADPSALAWNWADRAPAPSRFWYRRMAHETAVHRWDAQSAVGQPDPIETQLAVDGIDEYLTFVAARLSRKPVAGLGGSLHLHATDTEGEWSLTLAPDRLEHRHEHSKADAAVRGPVSDLLLWLVNRKAAGAGGLERFGDPALTETWRTHITF